MKNYRKTVIFQQLTDFILVSFTILLIRRVAVVVVYERNRLGAAMVYDVASLYSNQIHCTCTYIILHTYVHSTYYTHIVRTRTAHAKLVNCDNIRQLIDVQPQFQALVAYWCQFSSCNGRHVPLTFVRPS